VATGGGSGGRGRDKSSREADDTADACAFTKANTASGTNGSAVAAGVTMFSSDTMAAGPNGAAVCTNLLRTSVSSTVKAPRNGEEGAAEEITAERVAESGSAEIGTSEVARAGGTGVTDRSGGGEERRGVGVADAGPGGVGGRDVIAVYMAGN
jgi:hypothetical protein